MFIHAGAISARVTRFRASLTAVLTTAQLPRMPQNDCTPQTSSSRSSMQAVSAAGLYSAPEADRRCTIVCAHEAPEGLRTSLVEE